MVGSVLVLVAEAEDVERYVSFYGKTFNASALEAVPKSHLHGRTGYITVSGIEQEIQNLSRNSSRSTEGA